ncbi:NfeD family protein [Sphingomonas sp. MMS24-JH45]
MVTVEKAIVDGRGRVRVGDGSWPAVRPTSSKVPVRGSSRWTAASCASSHYDRACRGRSWQHG